MSRPGAARSYALLCCSEEGRAYGRLLHPLLNFILRRARLAAGCFLFCSRDAFNRAGGFDERLFGGEEIALSRAFERLGPFVILPTPVITSGRKLRAYSG